MDGLCPDGGTEDSHGMNPRADSGSDHSGGSGRDAGVSSGTSSSVAFGGTCDGDHGGESGNEPGASPAPSATSSGSHAGPSASSAPPGVSPRTLQNVCKHERMNTHLKAEVAAADTRLVRKASLNLWWIAPHDWVKLSFAPVQRIFGRGTSALYIISPNQDACCCLFNSSIPVEEPLPLRAFSRSASTCGSGSWPAPAEVHRRQPFRTSGGALSKHFALNRPGLAEMLQMLL